MDGTAEEPAPGGDSVQPRREDAPFPIVGIGASAGGLEAVTHLLETLPADTGMAFVIVQHLDPTHQSLLSELLSKSSRLPVRQVEDDMSVEPDHVYVIPPNNEMIIGEGRLKLRLRKDGHERHHPIDIFFRSLAGDVGGRAIGVILSGNASDGALGIKAIKEDGGITFAQDGASAKFDSMPRSAVATGCVDFVLPPDGIAAELARICRHPFVNHSHADTTSEPVEEKREQISRILRLLHKATRVDFTHYKPSTVHRRIMRRTVLHRMQTVGEYVRLLEQDTAEVQALYQDILIKVTSFFRERETFDVLKERVFPEMVRGRAPDQPIRVWVPGCATGEEAYSLVICLMEFAGKMPSVSTQVFGTDVSEAAVEAARAGIYPESHLAEVSADRLCRFFNRVEAGYQIARPVRDQCTFARQDLTRDPPFSSLDLIVCRNVLIYLDAVLQKRVLPILHYGLKAKGVLVLGGSETIGTFSDLFEVLDKKHKIYVKKQGPTRQVFRFSMAPEATEAEAAGGSGPFTWPAQEVQKEADRIVLTRFAPAGVLVSDSLEIVQFRGRTGRYLEPAPGEASLSLLRMAREGLVMELRHALDAARSTGETSRVGGVRVKYGGESLTVDLVVVPMKREPGERYYLVLFNEKEATEPVAVSPVPRPQGDAREERDVARMEQELASTREYLQSIIEEQEATNEELKSANEEILSSNEELQSINEELETAKEELQSTNEELTTVNEELGERNLELSLLNDDLNNLIASVNVGIVMISNDMRIRRFTPMAAKILKMIPGDAGRPFDHLKLDIGVTDLDKQIIGVIDTMATVEKEVRDSSGHWYSMRLRPYRTVDNKIDGVVVTLVDIDTLRRSLDRVQELNRYTDAVMDTVPQPLVVLDGELRVKEANRSFHETFRTTPGETDGLSLLELGSGQWNVPELREKLDGLKRRDTRFQGLEIEREFPELGRRIVWLSGRRVLQETSTVTILLAIEDVTERERSARELLASEVRYRRLFEAAKDGILLADADTGRISQINPCLEELLGISSDRLVGRVLWEAEAFRDVDAARAAFEELREKGYTRREDLKVDVRTGKRLDLELVGSVHELDGRNVIQCIFRDTTDRRRAQERAQSLAREQIARVEAEAANHMKDLFLATLSHELRTPLLQGGHVLVHLKRVGANAEISVTDTGKGIAPEFLPHVFDPFCQEEGGSARAQGGLGLGLTIARQLVELQGGSILAASDGEGHGATFTLTLPLADLEESVPILQGRPVESSSPAEHGRKPSLSGLQILIVEDEPDARGWLVMALEQCGAKVRAVATAGEALAELQRCRPDAIVSDIGLPGEDGYSLIQKVRDLPAEHGGRVPALALTAYAREEDRTRLLEAGFQVHVSKPVEPMKLASMIRNMLGNSQARPT